MSSAQVQSGRSALSSRLQQRLESLGVAVASVTADGRVALRGRHRPMEQLLAGSPVLGAAIASQWSALQGAADQPCLIWPGLLLLPLPLERRRRTGHIAHASELTVVLFVTRDLLASEELHRVCDTAGLDWQATCTQMQREGLIEPGEVGRLASAVTWMQQDSLEIDRRCNELQTMSQQLGESYEELSLLYKFTTSMTVDQTPVQFFTDACNELRQVLNLRWLALHLIDDDPRLNELAGRLFVAGQTQCDATILERVAKQLLMMQPAESQPMVVDDAATVGLPLLSRMTTSFLIVSLQRQDRPLGILFGGDKLDGAHISSVDSKLCNSLASSLAIFLENRMLFEDMQAMFMGTLHALTNAIDAKDSYTHGHSERVALVSKMLARAAGLDEQSCDRVYLAGLVHDLGKIGVPESVLCKPGQLTVQEFGLIRLHPDIGAKILQDIRQMHDLIPGVQHHHERWDGRGYPHGLKGEQIPLYGRLVCLADSFDAMSSNRTYRQGLKHEQVLNEIRRCAGTQFDPRLAEIFVTLDFTEFRELIQRHQAQPNPREHATP